MPLQSRCLERGPPFPSPIYSSYSSQRFSLIFKFEKAFEAIRKNERDCKQTLKSYNFRKPKRKASPNEQVGPIYIFDFKEEKHKDDCNKNKKHHHVKKSLPKSNSKESPHFQQEVHEKNKSTNNGCKSMWEKGVDSPR